jgi:diadenosine tetraphosphate (Ap4A) HIT family hydrolase
MTTGCAFCSGAGGALLWRDGRCRVVLTDEPFVGFCRVIWNAHVREMTDLSAADRAHCMDVAYAVESALRARLAPTKVNLASLGNVTPHLHWHVIPRFADDTHFPGPVWAPPLRAAPARALPPGFVEAVARDLAAALGPGEGGTPR